MKRLKLLTFSLAVLLTFVMLSVFCPIIVYAAKSQNVAAKNTITIETIDSIWCNQSGQVVTTIDLPEFVSPGEKLNINNGLYVKNIGVNAFARIKLESKINGVLKKAFDFTINSNWIKGNDNFYYYCNTSTAGVLYRNEINLVIEELYISKEFTSKNSDDVVSLVLSVEVLDASDTQYLTGWGDNPPQEWFDLLD